MRTLNVLVFVSFALCLFTKVTGVSVMAVDIGNEWLKIAIVSPGKPMEIVLNSDSQRKTPLIVAFRDGERFFGEAALTTATRFPEKCYSFILDLIGKRLDSSSVKLYRKRFPFHNITEDATHSKLLLHHPDGMTFTPEELLAMILQKAKLFAEEAAEGQTITETVITVPPYFTQSERRAMLYATQLAGLKVLQLINTYTGVALNYGVFRRKDFNESNPTNVLFYDMGSSSTSASVASYQLVKTKERGFLETNPQLMIKGVGFDRTLGGFEMQLRLRDHLARLFAEQHNKKLESILSNKRAMNKLLKEAGRLKKILSANTEINAQVENVMDDVDLKAPVTRAEFEEMCDDLFKERITNPIAEALKSSGLTVDELDQVILFGGNTRVPKVQQVLQEFLNGKELSKSINSDEAAALGAAYQAAYLSKGFKVKTFLVKELNIFPIQVEFTRAGDDSNAKQSKVVQRTLFTRNNVYPQKKVLTFSRHNADFEFTIKYGDLKNILPQHELDSMNLILKKVFVKNVASSLSKHTDKESKGIKAHFKMDDSGLLDLDHIEALFEYKVEEQVVDNKTGNVVGEAFAKFGETISQLFGGSKEGEKSEDTAETPSNATETKDEKETKDAKDTNTTAPESKDQPAVNDTAASAVNGTQMKTEIRIKTAREKLDVDVKMMYIPKVTQEEESESKQKLEDLNKKEEEKLARDQVKNGLESFIHETKMKLYEKEYEEAVTEEEKTKIENELNAAGEWLEYESDSAETSVFRDKLLALGSLTRDMFERVKEHRERPEALKTLTDMLNISHVFLNGARNVSEDAQIFTEVELNTLDSLITNTEKWVTDSVAEQSKTPLNQTPKLSVKQIAEKISLLDREIKYLINKAKITPPKKKETKAEEQSEPEEEKAKTEIPSLDEQQAEDTTETPAIGDEKFKSAEEDPLPSNVKDDPHSEL